MLSHRHTLPLVLLAYLGFVIYGSLIPFAFRDLGLDEALLRFRRIPWLDLDATARADWVANIVLYVPLTFLAAALLARGKGAARLLGLAFALTFGLGIALGVEFVQVFFHPRTVSRNDLLAESIGSLLGVAAWVLGHRRLVRVWRDFRQGDRRSVTAAIALFLGLYLLLALFPFDFVLSLRELDAKLNGRGCGILLANWRDTPARITIRLLGETLAILPLGVLIGILAPRVDLRRVFIAGLLLGLALELAQLGVVSGVSQGMSLATRGAGLAGGALAGRLLATHGLHPVAAWIRRGALFAWPFYLAALVIATGWTRRPALGLEAGLAKLPETSLLPFYYHYFTTEPIAMASLLANLALYAPLGLLAWARHAGRRHPLLPAAWAVLLATPVELSKLWLAKAHPDPTNLLIGAVGAVLAYLLADWLARIARHADQRPPGATTAAAAAQTPAGRDSAPAETVQPSGSRQRVARPPAHPARFAALPFAVLAVGGLFAYPQYMLLLGGGLAVYAWVLWRHPLAWLGVLPAALPVLDLAPFNGRTLLDAFDLLVLTSLAIGYWRLGLRKPAPWPTPGARRAVLLLLASAALATAIGAWPWNGLALDASHGPGEAFAVGKGLWFALACIPLLRHIAQDAREHAGRLLVGGLATGVTLLGILVLAERHTHVGITATASEFRVTGPFSAMYNGGAYIEAFIALALPALVVWTLRQHAIARRLAGLGAAALGSYAMLVTFSRGGYVALLVGFALLGMWSWRGRRHGRLVFAGILLACLAAALPVLLGSFAQSRLDRAGKDLDIRLAHWGHALELAQPGWRTLAGMGFGSYPRAYLWNSAAATPPGSYRVVDEGDRRVLRLGHGEALYLDQWIAIEAGEPLELRARVRFGGYVDGLRVYLCRKALLYSFTCRAHELRAPRGTDADAWLDLALPLDSSGLASPRVFAYPSVKLSLANPRDRGHIDIDRVSVRGAGGREVLANGDFSAGLTRWMPATDRDLAWHIHQTALEVFFAQGLLGLFATALLLFAVARQALPAARRGDRAAIALLAGLAGFLTVGLLGSTLDAARTGLLFHLACFAALFLTRDAPGYRRRATVPEPVLASRKTASRGSRA